MRRFERSNERSRGALTGLCPRGGAFVLCLLATSCESDETHNGLTRRQATDDTVELRGDWSYESFEVDVKLMLVTRIGPESCVSTGTLTVNDALSKKTHYDLAPTDCSELALSEGGDIVLEGEATGHNWTNEALVVDTSAEVVSLGPVTLTDADGNAVSYRFTLSAPPCPDTSGCKCGALQRVGGSSTLELSLGRRC